MMGLGKGGSKGFKYGSFFGIYVKFLGGSKWLITMVIVSPLNRVVGPLQNGLFMAGKWGLHGVTSHLLRGMILQVPPNHIFSHMLFQNGW